MSTKHMPASNPGLTVSLEPHLVVALTAILQLLPAGLETELTAYVAEPPQRTISHDLLHRLSLWSRTAEGGRELRSKFLNPQEYSMISLLAGTTTSPEKHFGDYTPPKEPEELAADRARERKAITALVNSLFSVFGAGFAAWWGADKTGWRDEYKVLFALAVGIVVAISEGTLFLIWSSRRAATSSKRHSVRHKKEGGAIQLDDLDKGHVVKASAQEGESHRLRHRRQ